MNLKINGMDFGYGAHSVLKDITIEINGPQLVSIIGPNGVGKSTLIHCMNKILSPKVGTVMIDGEDLKDKPLKDLAKTVGYVPYTASDAFPLSVVDTVMMGRHPHSSWKSLDSDLDMVYRTLDLLEIKDLAMRPFNELSAGQHQKVMIARGLVQEPKILLLDEPTANLDIKHQMSVTRLLRRLSLEKNILIIMISHDLNIAAKYSDNVIMMSEGKIFAVGTPEEVITEDNIRAVYDVESEVIMNHGRPHLILLDREFDDSIAPLDSGTYIR